MIVCEAGMLLGGKQIILLSFVISKTYFTATLIQLQMKKQKKQKRNNNLTNTNEHGKIINENYNQKPYNLINQRIMLYSCLAWLLPTILL